MRLFVALEIPSMVRDNLFALIHDLVAQDLRATAPESQGKDFRWVRPENLHVTLKFIGEAVPAKLDAIRDALASIRSDQPVSLRFGGLGFFPSGKRPRVLWVGMEASANLQPLAAAIDHSLEKLGFPREQRSFTPHLTLARLNDARKDAHIPEKLRSAIDKSASRDLGSLGTNKFHLIQSKLKPSGAEYSTLQSVAFAAEV